MAKTISTWCGCRILLALSLVFVASLVIATDAHAAHFIGDDSVDGREIRYEDQTKYDGARTAAITKWNNLGDINICLDDFWHICDLEIGDYSDTKPLAPLAYWQPQIGADHIRMNTAKLDPWTPSTERSETIKHVMAHELGHALGIDDHLDIKWHNVILMYLSTCNTCNWIQGPQAHDKVDYHALW